MFRQQKQQQPADKFMDYVQSHERAWGTDTYPGRPALEQILNSPVVIFWKPREETKKNKGLNTITLHTNLKEVEDYLFKLLTRAAIVQPDKYMVRIFENKKRVVLSGVRFAFKTLEDE